MLEDEAGFGRINNPSPAGTRKECVLQCRAIIFVSIGMPLALWNR